MHTPIPVGQYTRFQTSGFSDVDLRPVSTAYQSAFYGRPETGAVTVFNDRSSQINIDIQKGETQTLAMMVNRGASSTVTDRVPSDKEGRFTNLAYAWPLVETQGSISSNEILENRGFDQPQDMTASLRDRLTEKAGEIHKTHFKKHFTTMEFLAREALFTGQHPAILGTSNSDLIYDFHRNSNNFITAGTPWTTVTADILGDLDDGADQIQQNGGLHSDYGLLCDGAVFGGIKKNNTTGSDADNRRYEFVSLGGDVVVPSEFAKYKEAGFQPRGRLETNGGRFVWIFTYDVTFLDNFTTPGTKTRTPWVPAGKALMFSPLARCDKYFGPADRFMPTQQEIQNYRDFFGFDMGAMPVVPNVTDPGLFDPRMFTVYADITKKAVELFTQSAPIMPTTHTDAFVTFDSLV
jgi:hypothetical protein